MKNTLEGDFFIDGIWLTMDKKESNSLVIQEYTSDIDSDGNTENTEKRMSLVTDILSFKCQPNIQVEISWQTA